MKRGGKESKTIYVALLMPRSSAGVKYRHGVALMLFFSCDMWVPVWVTGVGSVLPLGQNIRCKRSIRESRWLVWRLWGKEIWSNLIMAMNWPKHVV